MARTDWEVFDAALPLLGRRYGAQHARMLAFGLRDGGLCAVSPGTGLDDDAFAALEAWGKPRFLLAPNHFHNLGIPAWVRRYPDAVVVAHARALPRLQRRLAPIPVAPLDALAAALPEGARLFSPPMARQGETWVSLRATSGTAWFVTDGLVNETRLPSGPVGWGMRLVGFRAKLMTNPFFHRMFLTDRPAWRAWVHAELDRDPPSLFVPAHGAVLRGEDVAERLRAAVGAP